MRKKGFALDSGVFRRCLRQGDQIGRMSWSQFSAIFDNFQRKNGVFLKNQCYDQIFHNLALFWVKNANLVAEFFCENI
jgi:hypothetical protein